MKDLKELTLKAVLERSNKLFGHRTAFSWVKGDPHTYKDVYEKVNEIKIFLHNNGIITGDRVAILAENSPNWGIAYLAITTMGAVVVPILPDFHENEVRHILRHSGTKAIFVSEKLYGKLPESKSNRMRILIDDFSIIPPETTKEKLNSILNSGSHEFAKLKESALKFTGFVSQQVRENDTAAIIYTSGTTGRSKGVMLTHKNLVFNILDTLNIQNLDEHDRLISILPLPHTYECTIGFLLPFSCGASIFYLDKPPVARVLLPAMAKIKPTMMLTVPLIMEKIFKTKIQPTFTQKKLLNVLYKIPFFRILLHKAAARKLYKSFGGKLHFFGIGGALLAPDVERFMRDAKFPYAIGYGLTETSPLIAGCSPSVTRYRSTGTVLPGLEVKIEKPNPKTGEGEILVKGPSVMKGYYKDPERTKEVLSDDGWFHTGDLGILTKDNYLYIKGRSKNVIIGPSGENIYPESIEAIISENEFVLESIVYSHEKKIIARIYLNYEMIDEIHGTSQHESKMEKIINKLLNDIKRETNSQLSQFSRISQVIEQTEPFEKTPTKKIKRYLYTN
ncbi:MAG: AMP-binding protein [Candidatus Cloacimonetes bacterium]|nr:AMP-binding protein [Candidatus Cloacimonadota bacterium]MCF7813272.1 AMP-binding protein [Candidatus Cloacimonadota bacterium]MCF7867347.1 AMP-binding protein [Candidatus Cloacimonadota bacterium]MCF7882781.1 AMP-binding protein [Candidatus Cloacimonadota bacterium]